MVTDDGLIEINWNLTPIKFSSIWGAEGQSLGSRFGQFLRLRRGAGGPTAEVLLCEFAHRLDPVGLVIQAGDVVEFFAAGVRKRFARLHIDLFEGFQAVAGKARADYIDPFDAGLPERDQRGLGVGLQPLGPA